MKKIISLFMRNFDTDRLVRNEVTLGAEWVIKGEGVATRKWDGTCCLIKDGKLYKRYEVKKGKTPPINFDPACPIDLITGKQQGWLPVGDGPEDKWHREAFLGKPLFEDDQSDGTYELCGPKVQGNPEHLLAHCLFPHGKYLLPNVPRTFEEIKEGLKNLDIEGIVWHHEDGRMVKIKAKDFGIKR